MDIKDTFTPIRKGLLQLVVLQVIATQRAYTADIIKTLSLTEFATQEGTLYPLLSRLRREGLVEYEWVESEAGPPRKYYRLTASGATHLKRLLGYWKALDAKIMDLGEKHA